MHPIERTKAERIAEDLVEKMIFYIRTESGDYLCHSIAKEHALVAVNHILEMLNVNEKVESVETYRHKLYTEVKQILEK